MGMPTEQQTIRVELPPAKETPITTQVAIPVIASLVLAIIYAIVAKRKNNG